MQMQMHLQQTDAIFLFRKLYLRTDVNNILSSRKNILGYHLDIPSSIDIGQFIGQHIEQLVGDIDNVLFIISASALTNVLYISFVS